MQPDTNKATQPKISPEEYGSHLNNLNLLNIYLKDVKASLFSNSVVGEKTYAVEEIPNLISNSNNKVTVDVTYKVTAKSGKKKILTAKIKYIAEFTTIGKIPDEFFEVYNSLSLPLQTYPYFREYVNSLFSRMGLPPLILPLRKFLIGDDR